MGGVGQMGIVLRVWLVYLAHLAPLDVWGPDLRLRGA